jgi:hypothetical protein
MTATHDKAYLCGFSARVSYRLDYVFSKTPIVERSCIPSNVLGMNHEIQTSEVVLCYHYILNQAAILYPRNLIGPWSCFLPQRTTLKYYSGAPN